MPPSFYYQQQTISAIRVCQSMIGEIKIEDWNPQTYQYRITVEDDIKIVISCNRGGNPFPPQYCSQIHWGWESIERTSWKLIFYCLGGLLETLSTQEYKWEFSERVFTCRSSDKIQSTRKKCNWLVNCVALIVCLWSVFDGVVISLIFSSSINHSASWMFHTNFEGICKTWVLRFNISYNGWVL